MKTLRMALLGFFFFFSNFQIQAMTDEQSNQLSTTIGVFRRAISAVQDGDRRVNTIEACHVASNNMRLAFIKISNEVGTSTTMQWRNLNASAERLNRQYQHLLRSNFGGELPPRREEGRVEILDARDGGGDDSGNIKDAGDRVPNGGYAETKTSDKTVYINSDTGSRDDSNEGVKEDEDEDDTNGGGGAEKNNYANNASISERELRHANYKGVQEVFNDILDYSRKQSVGFNDLALLLFEHSEMVGGLSGVTENQLTKNLKWLVESLENKRTKLLDKPVQIAETILIAYRQLGIAAAYQQLDLRKHGAVNSSDYNIIGSRAATLESVYSDLDELSLDEENSFYEARFPSLAKDGKILTYIGGKKISHLVLRRNLRWIVENLQLVPGNSKWVDTCVGYAANILMNYRFQGGLNTAYHVLDFENPVNENVPKRNWMQGRGGNSQDAFTDVTHPQIVIDYRFLQTQPCLNHNRRR